MTAPSAFEIFTNKNVMKGKFRGPFIGLDTTSGINTLDFMSLRVADNADLGDDGSVLKRKGTASVLSAPWSDRSIYQGFEYTKANGTTVILVAGKDQSSALGCLGQITSSAFGAPTDIRTNLTAIRPSIFSLNDLAFYFNGVDDFLFDGTTTRQIGITPPAGAPTLLSNTNGSLVAGASYIVAYTYYNTNTGAESSPSPLSTALTIAADPNDGITVTYVDGDATTATHVKFYRTLANGVQLKFDKQVTVGSGTTTTLIQADAGLVASRAIELDNSRHTVFGKFRYGWAAENRAILTGLTTNPNRVILSAITAAGIRAESFPAKNYVDCNSGKGYLDENLGGGMAGDTIIIIKRRSVGRIEKIGAATAQDFDDPVVFDYRQISEGTSALSHWGGCSIYGEYAWLGKDDVYATDGVNVRSIGNKIRQTLKDANLVSSDYISAFNDTENKRLYFAFPSQSGLTYADRILVGFYRNYPEVQWTLYRPGSNTSTHPGIKPGCIFEGAKLYAVSDFRRRVYFGNTDFTGKLFAFDSGRNDDTSAIAFQVRSAPLAFSLDDEEKMYGKSTILMKGSVTGFTITVQSYYNLSIAPSDTENKTVVPSDLWNDGDVWNDGTVWGGNQETNFIPHNSHKKAFYKQIEVLHSLKDQDVGILAFSMAADYTGDMGHLR